eukprot:scaffold1679_cov127-Isochrysis_galbana.AAC.6
MVDTVGRESRAHVQSTADQKSSPYTPTWLAPSTHGAPTNYRLPWNSRYARLCAECTQLSSPARGVHADSRWRD